MAVHVWIGGVSGAGVGERRPMRKKSVVDFRISYNGQRE